MLRVRPIRGFTLVEILCVVVILGIASAIIIPQLGTRDDLKTAAAARTVMSDLIYAQNSAIAQQRRYYVQFVGQQYSVSCDPTPLTPVAHPIHKNAFIVAFGSRNNGTDGVTLGAADFGAGATVVGFDELGAPFAYDNVTNPMLTTAGTIPITCGGTTITVAVQPYTGESTVN